MGGHRIFLSTSAALTCAVTVGIASTYSSTATESMRNGKLNPSDYEISWIGSILPLGAIIGGLVAGCLADRMGRKGVMMMLNLPLVLGWLCIAYAPNLTLVYVGRLLTGLCVGLICVVTPMYVVEVSTPETRGSLGSRFQFFICMGIILSSTFGEFLPWEWVAIVGAVVGVVSVLCMIPIPESPQWLVMNDKHADAIHAVNFLYGNINDPSINQLVNECLTVPTKKSLSFRELLQPTIYKPALLSIALMFFQQFCGSNAILYYTVSIFKQANSSVDPTLGNLFVAVVMFIFTLVAMNILDVIGRRMSLCISGFVMCAVLNCMSVYLLLSSHDPTLKSAYGWVPLACLLVYIAAFSLGFGPVPWLMMSEMAPVRGRGFICGLGTAFSWIFVFVITKTFLSIEDSVGNFGAYWIYSGFCVLACCFTLLFLPETKGKTMEEIEDYFAGGRPQIHPLPEVVNDRFTDFDG